MNLDDIQLPLLLNSLSGPGGGRDSKGGPEEVPGLGVGVAPTTGPAGPGPGRPQPPPAPGPGRSALPAGPPARAPTRRTARGCCSARPALGGLGTSPASELICLQTPSPCQRQ